MTAPEATAKNAEERARATAVAADRERETAVAAFLLATADELGVKVGTDGHELATVSTRKVPFDLVWQLERELVRHKRAVIEVIRQENIKRTGVFAPDAFKAEDGS